MWRAQSPACWPGGRKCQIPGPLSKDLRFSRACRGTLVAAARIKPCNQAIPQQSLCIDEHSCLFKKENVAQRESSMAPGGSVPSAARFSSARTASTTGVAAPTRAPGSCTTTPEAGNANTSVPAVADYLVNMVKKQIRSDSGTITPQTELESLLMRDDRHWDCLDTVEFLLDVEELFNVFIPDEVADCFRTIQLYCRRRIDINTEIADFVTKHRTEAAGDGAQGEVKDGKN